MARRRASLDLIRRVHEERPVEVQRPSVEQLVRVVDEGDSGAQPLDFRSQAEHQMVVAVHDVELLPRQAFGESTDRAVVPEFQDFLRNLSPQLEPTHLLRRRQPRSGGRQQGHVMARPDQ